MVLYSQRRGLSLEQNEIKDNPEDPDPDKDLDAHQYPDQD